MTLIEVRNLTKKYGDNIALDGISFDIKEGRIYGLLGPNGAGKSTAMNIITGCLAPTSGTVTVNGHDILKDPLEAKRHMGYLPEIPPLYPEMTTKEFLLFVGEVRNVEYSVGFAQVKELIDLCDLSDVENRLIKNLSKGYKQRVGIAAALVGDPETVILDEPATGLDPKQIVEIRELIRSLGEYKTIILSSHILSEVAAVCDDVIVIDKGKIIANDTLENLQKATRTSLVSIRGDENVIYDTLVSVDGITMAEKVDSPEEGVFRYKIQSEKDIRDDLFFALANQRCVLVGTEEKESLESVFMKLTGERETEEIETPPAEHPAELPAGEKPDEDTESVPGVGKEE